MPEKCGLGERGGSAWAVARGVVGCVYSCHGHGNHLAFQDESGHTLYSSMLHKRAVRDWHAQLPFPVLERYGFLQGCDTGPDSPDPELNEFVTEVLASLAERGVCQDGSCDPIMACRKT
jgi:hypothetical protein